LTHFAGALSKAGIGERFTYRRSSGPATAAAAAIAMATNNATKTRFRIAIPTLFQGCGIGFHSRSSRYASAIWSGVILVATSRTSS
jgi:hypothetical protein